MSCTSRSVISDIRWSIPVSQTVRATASSTLQLKWPGCGDATWNTISGGHPRRCRAMHMAYLYACNENKLRNGIKKDRKVGFRPCHVQSSSCHRCYSSKCMPLVEASMPCTSFSRVHFSSFLTKNGPLNALMWPEKVGRGFCLGLWSDTFEEDASERR